MDADLVRAEVMMEIWRGGPEHLRKLLDAGLSPDAKTHGGTSLLKYFAGENEPGLVRLLLDRGANVNSPDDRGFTPLGVAASLTFLNGYIEMLQMLLDAGADVRAISTLGGLSVLHEVGHPAAVRLLCERGADPNARDSAGNTPLHWARWDESSEEVIAALLACGADPALRNAQGLLPEDSPPDNWMDHVFPASA